MLLYCVSSNKRHSDLDMPSLFNIGKQQGCNDLLCHTRLFASHAPTCSNMRPIRVTGTNMATRCSRRVKTYSMDQLKARAICLTSEGGMIGARYAHMCNG